jgi:fibronectin-binding autotransporter adhesin
MKKLLFRLAGICATLSAPLLFASVAHAAAISWSGGGVGVVDATAKTITYNINNVLNWSGGVVPVAGDSLIFPANTAQIDPGSTIPQAEEQNWKYIVNNDLTADTIIAGISFTGDTGVSCYSDGDVNDGHVLSGNAITLTGDITNTRTGSCDSTYAHIPSVTLNMTISSSRLLDVTVNGSIITYGANVLTFGAPASTKNFNDSPNLHGTGKVIINGTTNWYESSGSSGYVKTLEVGPAATATISGITLAYTTDVTVKDMGSITLDGYSSDQEITTNFIFEGNAKVVPPPCISSCGQGGGGGGITPTYTTTYEASTYPTYARFGANDAAYVGTYPNSYSVYKKVNLKGSLTFSADLPVTANADVILSGPIHGGGKVIELRKPSPGSLTVSGTPNESTTPNGVTAPILRKIEYSGVFNDTYDITAFAGDFIVLKDGITLKKVIVSPRSRLGGIGTTGDLKVNPEGTLAPGMSPGCINTGNLTLNGNYDVDLGGLTVCTQYDQTNVTGTVDLTGSTLNIIRYNNMVPRLNNSFMIIKNDGADAVIGTFTGLAQGATVTSDGITYTVSYTGGDGNDVVLTVTGVSASLGAPNTGFAQLVKSGVLLPAFAALSGVGILAVQVISRKRK